MIQSLIIVLASIALTDTIKAPPKCACCDETHKQFDLWVDIFKGWYFGFLRENER